MKGTGGGGDQDREGNGENEGQESMVDEKGAGPSVRSGTNRFWGLPKAILGNDSSTDRSPTSIHRRRHRRPRESFASTGKAAGRRGDREQEGVANRRPSRFDREEEGRSGGGRGRGGVCEGEERVLPGATISVRSEEAIELEFSRLKVALFVRRRQEVRLYRMLEVEYDAGP